MTSGRLSGVELMNGTTTEGDRDRTTKVREIPVDRIRPEDGLGRKRDRDGHRELQQSIARFGVLTPITVRPAPDGSGEYLLIKGQGRTLACRLLGIKSIPAVIVDRKYAESEKVQQFLVENVARLKMRPIDRALLIFRARQEGEETKDIARRFGVSATTVRRLLAQLDGATSSEVAALRSGDVNLAMHAVVARHVLPSERLSVLNTLVHSSLKTKEADALLSGLGWSTIVREGVGNRRKRLALLKWACAVLGEIPAGNMTERLRQLALRFPLELTAESSTSTRSISIHRVQNEADKRRTRQASA